MPVKRKYTKSRYVKKRGTARPTRPYGHTRIYRKRGASRRRVSNLRKGSTTVTFTHTEFIRDIFPSSAFLMQVEEAVNPGLPDLFPWISEIASGFEEYAVKNLTFHFKSTSADSVLSSGNSTSLGTVIMAAQYNVLSPAYENKKDMLNNATCRSIKPSQSCAFKVQSKGLTKWYNVRTPTSELLGGDRRLYDHCDFHLAVEGCQADTGAIGELSVSCTFAFRRPTLQNRNVPMDHFVFHTTETSGVAFNQLNPRPAFNGAFLLPTEGTSSLHGFIVQDQTTGQWEYNFPETVDNLEDALFLINLHLRATARGTVPGTGAATVPASTGEYVLNAQAFNGTNCVAATIGGTGSLGVGYMTTPHTAAIGVSGVYTGGSDNYIYCRITGPNAKFSLGPLAPLPDTYTFQSTAATNGVITPAGVFPIERRMTISLIQYNYRG